MALKSLNKEEKELLLGEILGLAKTAASPATDGENREPDDDCRKALVAGLCLLSGQPVFGIRSRKGVLERIRKAKGDLAPGCSTCKYPCGRLEPVDVTLLAMEDGPVRSLKGEILANAKKAAIDLAAARKERDSETFADLCKALCTSLFQVAVGWNPDRLKTERKASEELRSGAAALREREEIRTLRERYMRMAIREAEKAAALGEVPIGCVIVKDGKVIGRGHNRRNTAHSVIGHAEICAMQAASRALSDWRLSDCTLYVTLEPCPMCAGAMLQSRMGACVFGAPSDRSGCAGTVTDLLRVNPFHQVVPVTAGICEEECSAQLTRFFENLRKT